MSDVVGVDRVRKGSRATAERVFAQTCSVGLLMAAGLVGCSGEIDGWGNEVAVTSSALTWTEGTNVITLNADVEEARCEGMDGLLGVTGSIAARTPTTIAMLVSIDGVSSQEIIVAVPAAFTVVGRDNVATFGTDADIPDGAHRVDICFAVVTASGVSAVRSCLPSVNTDLDCEMTPPMDTTPPSIVGSASPAANSAGWNNTDVTVSFMCADSDSGVASCTGDVTLSSEGAGQSASGSAVDNAGNSAMTTVSGINIDKTAPVISASRSDAPNDNGWNNTPVTVSFLCSDALSGVASCASDVTLSGEGAGQEASGDAVDAAGNGASVTEGPISIDMTAPVVSLSTNASYTVDQTVSVTCSASDALSGIDESTCASVGGEAYTFGVGSHTVTASAKDNAGNVGTASATFSVSVTPDSLCTLIRRFSSSRHHAAIGCALLESIERDLGKGGFSRITLKIKLCALSLWVSTTGRSIFTRAEADIIKSLIGDLAP